MAKGKKTGGIQKGYRYPDTLKAKDLCAEEGIEPIKELIRIMNSTENEFIQLSAVKELCKYCYSIPRDTGEDKNNSEDAINEFLNRIKDVSEETLLKALEHKGKSRDEGK